MIERRDVDAVGMAPLDRLLELPGIAKQNDAFAPPAKRPARSPATSARLRR